VQRFALLAAVVATACDATTASLSPDASPLASCEAMFDADVVKTCTVASDCVLLYHPECCSAVEIGVAASDASSADAAEMTFDACSLHVCGARGCASPTIAEDGTVLRNSAQMIVPTCIAGQCSSTVQ
jgi:hypothetical protein